MGAALEPRRHLPGRPEETLPEPDCQNNGKNVTRWLIAAVPLQVECPHNAPNTCVGVHIPSTPLPPRCKYTLYLVYGEFRAGVWFVEKPFGGFCMCDNVLVLATLSRTSEADTLSARSSRIRAPLTPLFRGEVAVAQLLRFLQKV